MNWLSLTNNAVEVQDFRKSTDHFRGIYGIYLKLIKEDQNIPSNVWEVFGHSRSRS